MNLWSIIMGWIEVAEEAYRNRNMPDETQSPPVTSEVSVTPPASRLPEFFRRISNYEGANPENNNPINERYYYGGYLPKYGVVKCSSGGFAQFSTLELGIEYGMTCLQEMVLNHPEWDFLDFFNRFAPSSDGNNTVLYARTIAAEMQVVVTANLKSTLEI